MARTAVVTAGTGGIGLETALGLTEAGYAVTVVGRNTERGTNAVNTINARGGETARFLQADLADLDQVRALGARLTTEGQLDVLVNNVGAMFADHTLINGVEGAFVVNHLSPYLLTELLLPTLAGGRVVNVTSKAVVTAKTAFDEAEPPGGYYAFHWYGRAKLANLAYTLDLAARQTTVTVLAADPGAAATDMTDGTLTDPKIVSPALRLAWPYVRRTFQRSTSGPASTAARSSIRAATDPTLASGTVLGPDTTPAKPHRAATKPHVQQAVRKLSQRHAPLSHVPDAVSN